MNQHTYQPFTRLDSIRQFLFRIAAKGLLPYRWFNKNLPEKSQLAVTRLPLKLEIVSHCWKYSNFMTYQLSSLVKYPANQVQIKLTVYYSEEDPATTKLLNFFKTQSVANVEWNFVALPKEQLFRRSIGRNMAAKESTADWVWFTDCDLVFHEGSIDALADQVKGRLDYMVYPQEMLITELLDKDDPLIQIDENQPGIREIDLGKFTSRTYTRATGPIQIVHGDVARACGYCDDLEVFQKSMSRWSKCFEDRVFRWLINSQGVPIKVPNVFFIRHAEKGRYQKDSKMAQLRKSNRKIRWAIFRK